MRSDLSAVYIRAIRSKVELLEEINAAATEAAAEAAAEAAGGGGPSPAKTA